jgi:hypothetical protein
MPVRLYITATAPGRPHLPSPPIDLPTSSTHLLEQWRATHRTMMARRTTASAAACCTSGRADCCTRPATWRHRTSGRPEDGASGPAASRSRRHQQDDDSSDNDGGDYTRFYRHFGMYKMRVFKFRLAEFEYMTNLAYICNISPYLI